MNESTKTTVWLIDDEADLLETCTELLNQYFDVRTFSSATEVIAALQTGSPPAVFVTDIKMPGMDGLQLTEHVRNLKIESPVIVVSGYADKSHAVKALDLGVFALLDKPFHPTEFRHTIKKAVAHSELLRLTETLLTRYSGLIDSMEGLLQKTRDRYIAAENQIPPGPISQAEAQRALQFMKEVVAETKLEESIAHLREEIGSSLKSRNALRLVGR
ncbi:MAG TPA: hypothetical protein DCS07_08570 [Bdellovibrionales bacterium]|nr:MAG: hypothetical protein A2Z97_02960 [Bdellovibrionales bacterium GWB1_52_6]OFZ03450.1 MAG: hypothetical protein A2X97_05745 [Bdellovibrionales bacterium GWA1_52_35]OFZ41595.1 MAG: hypothetical protein A2070_04155 [Bdellovibrionales bacterium GWC1_52_8]HAR42664.1 hypothetical protein [Bdellovibrionales bacterium]HCM41031.1 hypothetical protein [Bdellovibrionales bacterium]